MNYIKILILTFTLIILNGCSAKEAYEQGYKDGESAGFNSGFKTKNLGSS